MGLSIEREHFTEDDHRRFAARLREDLAALARLLGRPGFGEGPPSLGVEVELSLVDPDGRPVAARLAPAGPDPESPGAGAPSPRARSTNLAVLEAAGDARLTVELDAFNLEINSRPVALAGHPFAGLRREIEDVLARVRAAAAPLGGRPVLVGVLPTVRARDLGPAVMTDVPRFRALSGAIRALRGDAPLHLRIDGEEPLDVEADVTWEGANTSFQIHLRVPPADFARLYDAAQIATAPALAASGNAPLFLGHRLWEETRIAVFKQAVDERGELPDTWHPAARVSFGHGWLHGDLHALLSEAVALHAPLLPVVDDEEPHTVLDAGGVPRLEPLRLHAGTVWRWNRGVYDPADGGHVRIELRALPSGPTVTDMLANAAFLVGTTLALRDDVDWMRPALPFEHAHRNFYRAAQLGLASQLLWPRTEAPSPRPESAPAVIARLVPRARSALVEAGVAAEEAEALLAVFATRAATGRTGAQWQRRMLAALESRGLSREKALEGLVTRYLEHAGADRPVHTWPEWDAWEEGA